MLFVFVIISTRIISVITKMGKVMKRIIYTIILLGTLTSIPFKVFANPPLAYEGRGLYVSYCQLCHGLAVKEMVLLQRQ